MYSLCACAAVENELPNIFFYAVNNYISFRTTLTSELRDTDISLVSRSFDDILRVILYGYKRSNPCTNKKILTATIKYIKNTQKFNQPLF